jgi:PBSX family phage terminase large subunit
MNNIVYGFTPHQGQQRVIDVVTKTSAKYITVVSPRQIGKSILLTNLILYYSINDKKEPIIGIISPVYSQVRKLMDDLHGAIAASGIIESANFSNHEIKLRTGAKIIFRSSEREDSLRGNTFDYLFLDEAAYQTQEAWKNVILPTALVKGKKVVLFSTPRGTNNWFYEIYKMGESEDYPNYASVRMYQGENKLIDPQEIEAARKSLPDTIYRAEYEGEFIEGESTVFSNFKNSVQKGLVQPKGKVFCGLDLARKGDYTVAVFIDSTNRVIDILRINNTSWDDIVKQLLLKIRKYNASVLVETNSIGDVIFEQLKNQWSNVTPFSTTNESKKEIIETLIYAFNSDSIKIPDDKELISELETFEMTYSPQSRSVKYAARQGFHDDMVIALALANYHKTQNKSYGNYAVVGARY